MARNLNRNLWVADLVIGLNQTRAAISAARTLSSRKGG